MFKRNLLKLLAKNLNLRAYVAVIIPHRGPPEVKLFGSRTDAQRWADQFTGIKVVTQVGLDLGDFL